MAECKKKTTGSMAETSTRCRNVRQEQECARRNENRSRTGPKDQINQDVNQQEIVNYPTLFFIRFLDMQEKAK